MTILEQQVDAIMRLCTAADESSRAEARQQLKFLMQGRQTGAVLPDPERILRDMLLELGTPEHLVGYEYVIQAVLLVVYDRMYINNITFGLYPQVAARFDTTAARVERAIRHLIEVTWTRGDLEILQRYFGNTINPARGKPTNGEFIARLSNLVRLRTKE